MQSLAKSTNNAISLFTKMQRNKISFRDPNVYNLRWQFKWRHSYYTYPKEPEPTHVKKPEDTNKGTYIFWSYYWDVLHRSFPTLRMIYERLNRVTDPFNLYFLPGSSLLFYQLADINFGFKVLTFAPLLLMFTRIRDKTKDPDMKETYLRDILYSNAEVTKYFNEESIHVLDYDFEYEKGYLDPQVFPEYDNKFWRFFNNDTGCCKGYFKFGDLESGATMTLHIKTMPAYGRNRYQVGEPFYYYSLKADILHKGILKEVVLIDENEELKKMRPFLYLI